MSEADFILAFSNSVGVGPKSFLRLLKVFGSAKDAWEKSSPAKFKEAGVGEANYKKFEQFKKQFDIPEYLKKLKKAKVVFIQYGDKYYPESLKAIDSPPIGLFVKGNKKLLLKCVIPAKAGIQNGIELDPRVLPPPRLWRAGKPEDDSRVIAVVGARKVTSYGRQVTENLVSELCSNNFIIVSGMALGVDGIAHKTAIEQKGSTIAVLGCGVDCPYPRENERLYEEILDSGGLIISEYPLGMPANPGTFPARNRIVAGLSSSVLITEAAEDSGSLITAELAIKQGKTVFAVPGPINSRMSAGTAKLMKQGAVIVTSVNDILENLQFPITNFQSINQLKNLQLNKQEQRVFEAIQNEEKSVDEIARETKIPVGKLMSILSGMELTGIVKSSNGKFSIQG